VVDISELERLPAVVSAPRLARYEQRYRGRTDLDSVRLLERERRAVDDALATLRRRGVADPSAGQVVAASNFGLGVGLTDAGVPRHPTLSYETALWQPRIVRAFPNLGTTRRKQLHRQLDDLRRFRNRLAHHEPVFDAPLERIRVDLVAVARAVDLDAATLIGSAQRIDAVLARKRDAIERGCTVI